MATSTSSASNSASMNPNTTATALGDDSLLASNASFYDKTRWKKDPKYPLICGFLFIHATLHTTFASILHSIRTLALPRSSSDAEDDEALLQSLLNEVDLKGNSSKKGGKKKGRKTAGTVQQQRKPKGEEDHEHIDLAKEKTKKLVVEIAQRYEHWRNLHRQHSLGEDTVIFPAILRALPPSTLTLSSHQHGHKEQERRVKYIEAIFKGMIENPSERLRKQLVQAMEAFSDDQESHYREEENDIVPKCLAHLSPQQLGPLVPQILNDYRLYKSAIQSAATPTISNFVEKKHHHAHAAVIKNQDREEQEAILNDLAFLEEKRNNIMRFWMSLSPGERSKLLVIDHPMLVSIWTKKLAIRGGDVKSDNLVIQEGNVASQSHFELPLDFFSLEKDNSIGTNFLRLGTNVSAEGSLLFTALDRLTGNLFLRAPLFQIFRRLLTSSPNASAANETEAQEMLLIFEMERLLRLGHRNASESMLLNQVSLEKEEQKMKEENRRKKNQKKRQKQKEKEKLQKQILQKQLEEEKEEMERKLKEEEAIVLLKSEERRRQERLRNLRKQAQLNKLIHLMEELQLQHSLSQHNTIEVEDDGDIEFDDENDQVFEGEGTNSTSELEIVISDDDDDAEEEGEDSENDNDLSSSDIERSSATLLNSEERMSDENLGEVLSIIYKATEKILNDHARDVAIRQFYSPSNYLQLIHISLNPVDQIFALYQSRGNSIVYHKYSITHLQHALQCATIAERDGAQATEIAAAFLHDIGCLLFADTTHDQIGCEFLSQCGFKKEVTQPILWHEMYEDEDDHDHDSAEKEKAIVVRQPLERQTEFSQQAKALMKRDRAALENVQTSQAYNLDHFRVYLEQCLQRYF